MGSKNKSEIIAENYIKESVYVDVPASYEGVIPSDPEYSGKTIRLALDYVLPADVCGNPLKGPFPAIIAASRDPQRFIEGEGNGTGSLAVYMVLRGYAHIIINMRGCGASFGVNNSFASLENRLDIKYIMENWAPSQPWYNGSFATMGGSNRGLIQGAVAAVAPAGLKGITPVVCNMDFYYNNFINGVSACLADINGNASSAGKGISGTAKQVARPYEEWIETTPVAFVDEDPEGLLAYEAYKLQVEKNRPFTTEFMLPGMLRDDPNPRMRGERVYETVPPMNYLQVMKDAGIKSHQLIGLYDANATGQLAFANALDGGKVVIGDWGHGETIRESAKAPERSFDTKADYLSWFDWLLKGMHSEYETAPRFTYRVIGVDPLKAWRTADSFPPEEAELITLDLAESFDRAASDPGAAAEIQTPDQNVLPCSPATDSCELCESRNPGPNAVPGSPDHGQNAVPGSQDFGIVSADKVQNAEAEILRLDYKVRTDISLPEDYSWRMMTSTKPLNSCIDAKSLCFTSAPFEKTVELAGIPTLDLWVSSKDVKDIDILAYLELVDGEGRSFHMARGYMRASHRDTAPNPMWDSTTGMAGRFHPGTGALVKARMEEGLEKPVKLSFCFDLVSQAVKRGQRLRLSINCANLSGCQHYMLYDFNGSEYVLKPEADMPVISLYAGGSMKSFLQVPGVIAD